MKRFSITLCCVVAAMMCSLTTPVRAQETVAVTEFMNTPYTSSQLWAEWIELYNWSNSTVNLTSWKMRDDDTDNADIPNCSIPAKGFLIVARNKQYFEAEWLGGIPNAQVVQWVPSGATVQFAMGANDDEIVLLNGSSQIVWRLRYQADDIEGRGTFLSSDAFNATTIIRNYGSKGTGAVAPINRNNAPDPGNPAILGYEGNNTTADPMVYTGYNQTQGGIGQHNYGSPLRGNYPGAVNPTFGSRAIDVSLPGTPFNPGVRGIALHDVRMTEQRYLYAIPKALEVSNNTSIRGVTGGLYADQYDWKTRNSQHRPTTLQFMKYQRDTNSRMYVTANTRGLIEPDPVNPGKNRFYTTDTATLANLAADWVRYTNRIVQIYRQGDTITDARDQSILSSLVWNTGINTAFGGVDTWPTLLAPAETTCPKVTYWEIGNEPRVSLTGGIAVTNGFPLSVTDYYTRYKAITQAMLAEDPTIKVGPCVVQYSGDEDHLNMILADPACQVDFIAYHPYGNMDDETSATQTNLQANLHGAFARQYDYARGTRAIITNNRPSANIALIASETNVSNWPTNEQPLIGSMAHTIGSVESIFSWARLGLDAAHYWIWPSNQWDGFEYPVHTALEHLQDTMGDTLLDVYVDTNRARAYTTLDSVTGEVSIWGLNFSPTTDYSVQFQLPGLGSKVPVLERLGVPNGTTTLLSSNVPSWLPGASNDIAWHAGTITGLPSAADFTVTFKAATLNVITFAPGPTAVTSDWTLY